MDYNLTRFAARQTANLCAGKHPLVPDGLADVPGRPELKSPGVASFAEAIPQHLMSSL
jgi:hypothetical protein